MRWKALSLVVWTACLISPLWAGDASGNRLTYLDGSDPYYVSTSFPRLTTPQWVGEEGVDAVVVLAIDDMLDPEKYEAYLRPILDRLKQIDGRAPVSIMTCSLKPDDPRLKQWLDENMARYGFYRPYRTYRGGVFPEPWHLSYAPVSTLALERLTPHVFAETVRESDILGRDLVLERVEAFYRRYLANVDAPEFPARRAPV